MLVQLSNSARRKHGHSHVLLLWLMHSGGEITDSSPQMQLCSLVNVCEVSLMIIYKLLFGIIAARYHAFSSSEWSTSVNETYTNKKICMWLIPIAEAASKQLSITVSHKRNCNWIDKIYTRFNWFSGLLWKSKAPRNKRKLHEWINF